MSLSASVIICVYTELRWDDILAAIRSAHAQTRKFESVIVVVDHNERLFDRLRAETLDIQLVANSGAKGLSSARNCGIAATRSDLVAFLDDDAAAEPRWLEVLAGHFENPDVMGVGSWVTPLWTGQKPKWFPAQYLWVVGCSYEGMPTELSEIRNLFGGSMVVRRSLFSSVGGFDSRLGRDTGVLPLGCEETELCIRARAATESVRFLLDPTVAITHRVNSERLTAKYFFLRCLAEGVSKWRLTKICGEHMGLSSERRFLTHVLPPAVLKTVLDFCKGDAAALVRLFLLLGGFGAAGAGFAYASMKSHLEKRPGPRVTSGVKG